MFLEFRGNMAGGVVGSSSSFSSGHLVRCVSGSARVKEVPEFVDNGDGTILEKISGLTWTKCARFQDLPNCAGGSGAVTWIGALEYCNELTQTNFANRSWRLPSIRELVTLLNSEQSVAPRTYPNFFPNTLQYYWSSTTRANASSEAWTINFTDAEIVSLSKTLIGIGRVRCVVQD
jgi:hypothetical protein